MAVKIITDSTADISNSLIQSLGIEVLSLYVTFGEDNIKDSDISNEDFYKRMEAEEIPISSQPAVGDILIAMKETVEAGDDFVCVFLSSAMSGTFQSATLTMEYLQEEYPEAKMAVIDSESTSMQLGYCAIEGARLAQAGGDFESVVKKVKDTVARTRFLFTPNSLDYLNKGGRIRGAKTLFGNMFKVTPILTVKDKEADVLLTVRTKKRAKATIIEHVVEDDKLYKVEEACVHHINAYDEAVSLKEDLAKVLDVPITIGDIGPVIGLHVGPGAVGIAYRTKYEILNDK